MKIIFDNEKEENHRLVTIQSKEECICCILDIMLDGLKALGFKECEVYGAVMAKSQEIEEFLESMEEGDEHD